MIMFFSGFFSLIFGVFFLLGGGHFQTLMTYGLNAINGWIIFGVSFVLIGIILLTLHFFRKHK